MDKTPIKEIYIKLYSYFKGNQRNAIWQCEINRAFDKCLCNNCPLQTSRFCGESFQEEEALIYLVKKYPSVLLGEENNFYEKR